jgi:hypothetical protein
VYQLYAHARIASIVRKSGEQRRVGSLLCRLLPQIHCCIFTAAAVVQHCT